MSRRSLSVILACAALIISQSVIGGQDVPDRLRTVAEKSGFKATAKHADVVALLAELARSSPRVRLGEVGKTVEGRTIPYAIVADPPVEKPSDLKGGNRLVVLALGNIHAGEVCGKEALPMVVRDLALAKEPGVLKDLVFLVVPNFNADGNERIAKTNRPGQNGPEEGMGIRANSQGLDLNRDFVKLDSPEVRALVALVNQWDPALFIDTHATNGSYHRYLITYDGARNPACDPKLIEYTHQKLLPDVAERFQKRGGKEAFYYGFFTFGKARWDAYPPTPRYGIQYFALRNRLAVLSEAYSYAPYKDRVLGTRDFVHAILEHAVANKETIAKHLSAALETTGKLAANVAIRQKVVPLPGSYKIKGYVEEERDGKRVRTEEFKDYPVEVLAKSEPTLTVTRPVAYLIPEKFQPAIDTLQRHGIEVEVLREELELDVEAYKLEKVAAAERPYQNHRPLAIEAIATARPHRVPAGSFVVRTQQPLGTLAVYLLEPQSEDGLAVWEAFSPLAAGQEFPVLRLPKDGYLPTVKARPLPEQRSFNKPIRYLDSKYNPADLPNFGAAFVRGGGGGGIRWLDDGEHYLQARGGKLMKVHAASGRGTPFIDAATAERIAEHLKKAGMNEIAARAAATSSAPNLTADKLGMLVDEGGESYFAAVDGSRAMKLTKGGGRRELVTLSPTGKHVAFVRGGNLFSIDVASATEHQLTEDGGGVISNGKADWVYFEEVFDRNWKAFWWSKDGEKIVFLRFDDKPVKNFTVIDELPVRQTVEVTPYPKAGDPNPLVKVGIVSANGGPVVFADLSGYTDNATLIVEAGFTPDSANAWCYLQDRAQTWLDMCLIDPVSGKLTKLLRDQTKAWVDNPGPPHFLKDGSFLLFSARDGYKHLYHFSPRGTLLRQLTSGPWEARTLHGVDEASGWVYFSGTKDGTLGSNTYCVRLDGRDLTRLTQGAGTHTVNFSPKFNRFLASHGTLQQPTQQRLCRADGTLERVLDINPVFALEEYQFGKVEWVTIKMPDGFELDGQLIYPPHFDAAKKYPVWFKTYAGPAMPTLADRWSGGQVADQALASMGFIVFKFDPRSATAKGALAAWSAYRQLGVAELADIESAIEWLCQKPFVDRARIGMSGHSYGGFITAYALTHSKKFAAGIAGAPVTDWHNYDTIYTERYMNTPQENPDGYNKTSVVKAARNLHGKLLIVHGVMDDNVHVQNALQLVHALQQADKDFEVMFYPRARHGIFGRHYQRLLIDFMVRHLKPEAASQGPSAAP